MQLAVTSTGKFYKKHDKTLKGSKEVTLIFQTILHKKRQFGGMRPKPIFPDRNSVQGLKFVFPLKNSIFFGTEFETPEF